jgi:hypothetical protein
MHKNQSKIILHEWWVARVYRAARALLTDLGRGAGDALGFGASTQRNTSPRFQSWQHTVTRAEAETRYRADMGAGYGTEKIAY